MCVCIQLLFIQPVACAYFICNHNCALSKNKCLKNTGRNAQKKQVLRKRERNGKALTTIFDLTSVDVLAYSCENWFQYHCLHEHHQKSMSQVETVRFEFAFLFLFWLTLFCFVWVKVDGRAISLFRRPKFEYSFYLWRAKKESSRKNRNVVTI